MKRANVIIRIIVPMLILCALVSGCAVEQTIPAGPTEQYLTLDQVKLDNEICQKPDLPDWQVQRQKISEAVGDKVFDKEFGRVFDSLTRLLQPWEYTLQPWNANPASSVSRAPSLSSPRHGSGTPVQRMGGVVSILQCGSRPASPKGEGNRPFTGRDADERIAMFLHDDLSRETKRQTNEGQTPFRRGLLPTDC